MVLRIREVDTDRWLRFHSNDLGVLRISDYRAILDARERLEKSSR